MLETVREFALERLTESGEETEARRAHAAWCLAFVAEAERTLRGPDQHLWLLRFDAALENVRGALDWLCACQDADAAQRIAADSWMFLLIQGRIVEGRAWIERALSLGDEPRGVANVRVLCVAIMTDLMFGDIARANERAEAALARARAVNDPLLIGQALTHLGQAEAANRDPTHPELVRLEEALRILQAANPRHWLVAFTLGLLAWHTLMRGDHERADVLSDRALRLRRELGGPWGIADALMEHGHVAYRRGDLGRAAVLWREGLALGWELGDAGHLSNRLVPFGQLAVTDGQFAVAARLLGAAAAFAERVGLEFAPDGRPGLLQDIGQTWDALGTSGFAAAWEAGRSLSMAAAVAEAKGLELGAAPDPSVAESGPRLTPREREVLRLLSRGMTDAQIGEVLFISTSTASRHVANIYQKLGVNSRAEATAFAYEHRLLPVIDPPDMALAIESATA